MTDSTFPDLEKVRADLLRANQHRERQLDELDQRIDAVTDKSDRELERLGALVPTLGADPTDLEYLTWRAARLDCDLAVFSNILAIAELRVKAEALRVEMFDTQIRITQVEHLDDWGIYEIGQHDEMALSLLAAKEAAADCAHAVARREITRRRLAHTKTLHRDICEGLRKLEETAPVDGEG